MNYVKLPYPRVRGSFLYCWKCGAEYSADRGDYFWADSEDKAMCRGGWGLTLHRPIVLRLMVRSSSLTEVAVSMS